MDTAWTSEGQARNGLQPWQVIPGNDLPPKFTTMQTGGHTHIVLRHPSQCREQPFACHLLEVFSCVHFCEGFKLPWGKGQNTQYLSLRCSGMSNVTGDRWKEG